MNDLDFNGPLCCIGEAVENCVVEQSEANNNLTVGIEDNALFDLGTHQSPKGDMAL